MSANKLPLFLHQWDPARPLQSSMENVEAGALRIRNAIECAIQKIPEAKQKLLRDIPGSADRIWGFSLLLSTWAVTRENPSSELARTVELLPVRGLASFWRALDDRGAILGFVQKAFQARSHRDLRDSCDLIARTLGGTALDLFASILASESLLIATQLGDRFPAPVKLSPPLPSYSDLDVEAAARMLASENPRGSEELHAEQIWTQLRLRKPRQSLYDRITAGSGWGPQGGRSGKGGTRPVATTEEATDALRERARRVFNAEIVSSLPRATKWFEPEIQDRAHRKAQSLQRKLEQGEPLSETELHLLKYSKSADEVRAEWRKKGGEPVGPLEGLEFWT